MKQILKCSLLCGAFALFLITTVVAQPQRKAQRPPLSKEEMAERQWIKVSRSLTLDDATQAKFEPVYKKYQSEKIALLPDRPAIKPSADEKAKQLTDADADRIIKERLDRATKLAEINKRYYTEFRKILSSKQILRVFETEKHTGRHAKGKVSQRLHANGTTNR